MLKLLCSFPVGDIGDNDVQEDGNLFFQVNISCMVGRCGQVEFLNKLLEYMFFHAKLVLDAMRIAIQELQKSHYPCQNGGVIRLLEQEPL